MKHFHNLELKCQQIGSKLLKWLWQCLVSCHTWFVQADSLEWSRKISHIMCIDSFRLSGPNSCFWYMRCCCLWQNKDCYATDKYSHFGCQVILFLWTVWLDPCQLDWVLGCLFLPQSSKNKIVLKMSKNIGYKTACPVYQDLDTSWLTLPRVSSAKSYHLAELTRVT